MLTGLAVGGLLTALAGACLWVSNSNQRLEAKRKTDALAAKVMQPGSTNASWDAAQAAASSRADDLKQITVTGGQVCISAETSLAGGIGTVMDSVFTAADATAAAKYYRDLFGRAPASDAEAKLLELRRRAIEKKLEEQNIKNCRGLEKALLKTYYYGLAVDTNRMRAQNPGLYGKLSDAQIQDKSADVQLKRRLNELGRQLESLKKELVKAGVTPTAASLNSLVKARYDQDLAAFQKEFIKQVIASVNGPYVGKFSGAFSGEAAVFVEDGVVTGQFTKSDAAQGSESLRFEIHGKVQWKDRAVAADLDGWLSSAGGLATSPATVSNSKRTASGSQHAGSYIDEMSDQDWHDLTGVGGETQSPMAQPIPIKGGLKGSFKGKSLKGTWEVSTSEARRYSGGFEVVK